MAESLGMADIKRMLLAVAEKLKANHEHLSKLDAAVGDGDHGSAMLRVAGAIEDTLGKSEGKSEGEGKGEAEGKGEDKNLKALLHDVGWAVMAVPGGSTGPLYGSFVTGLSEGVGEKDSLDCAGVADMLEAGQARLRKQTKAKEGDKTMIDALVPAVSAVRAGADSGEGIVDTLRDAVAAAEKGAEATKDMKAAHGRARNLGERTIGHMDPGATSMSLVFAGLLEGATD